MVLNSRKGWIDQKWVVIGILVLLLGLLAVGKKVPFTGQNIVSTEEDFSLCTSTNGTLQNDTFIDSSCLLLTKFENNVCDISDPSWCGGYPENSKFDCITESKSICTLSVGGEECSVVYGGVCKIKPEYASSCDAKNVVVCSCPVNKEYVVGKGCEVEKPACIDVVAFAKNSVTGECRGFSTPCSIPSGWEFTGYTNESCSVDLGPFCVQLAVPPYCPDGTLVSQGFNNLTGCELPYLCIAKNETVGEPTIPPPKAPEGGSLQPYVQPQPEVTPIQPMHPPPDNTSYYLGGALVLFGLVGIVIWRLRNA